LFDEGIGFGVVGGGKFCIVPTMLKSLALHAARQTSGGDVIQ
jgi:hypothetical protein